VNVSRLIHAFLCISFVATSTAGGQTSDTVRTSKKPLFNWGDAAILGGFTLATIGLAPLDRHLTHQLQIPARQSNKVLHRSATIFRILGDPGSLVTATGFYFLGRFDGHRRTEDLGLHTVESILLADGVTTVVKYTAGRARPRISEDNADNFQVMRGFQNDDYRSFPSGHTTSAFAFAAAVSSETQKWWPKSRWIIGPIVYGGATLTGVSRIYNKAHWASDVMAGAAIGTFMGIKVVRYQHSHPGNRLDRTFLRAGLSHPDGGGWLPIISTARY
jgi:membrane-associated phospholipid phosphatase